MRNFIYTSTHSKEPIVPDFLKFMNKWAKTNDLKCEIEALIDNYQDQVLKNIQNENEGLMLQHENRNFLMRLILSNDDIEWFCTVQMCKTENDCLVCIEEKGIKPLTLDEVTLVIIGERNLIHNRILEIAEEDNIDILEHDAPIFLVFTKKGRYPYTVRGGLLFWRKWISINRIAQQKFTLSETPGDTRMTVDDKILNKVVAFYRDEECSLHLFDELGNEAIINFNLEHDTVEREIPDNGPMTNIGLMYFVIDIISEQFTYYDDIEHFQIRVGDEECGLTVVSNIFNREENKLYIGGRKMFEIIE